MTWEGVPWMVNEADHTAEVGRLLAYVSTGGVEGVASPGDCKVVASGIPDGNVHVDGGGLVVQNRFPGGGQQSYVLRNVGDAPLALDPQGSSGVRYDLVAVIVEDPQYAGQPAPADVADGPYVRLVAYKNVGQNATSLSQVDPDQTGYALARVKFDASDGTITNADITDLRALAVPHENRRLFPVEIPPLHALQSAEYVVWPGVWNVVSIPEWATKAIVLVHLPSMIQVGGAANGDLRVALGNNLVGVEYSYDYDATDGAARHSNTILGQYDIPEELRGTIQGVHVQGRRTGGPGYLTSGQWGLTIMFDITFLEETV